MSDRVIVCALTSAPHVEGSIEETCARCGRAIWLGPTMQLERAATFAALRCWDCAIEDGMEPGGALTTLGVLRELRQYDEEHGTDIALRGFLRSIRDGWLAGIVP